MQIVIIIRLHSYILYTCTVYRVTPKNWHHFCMPQLYQILIKILLTYSSDCA